MKKLLLATMLPATLSILSLPGSAWAQTQVTVYGTVDAGLVHERGGAAGNVTKLTSGVGSISQIGFRGTEDLGGGLSALFVLESGFRVDTGAADVTGAAFNRQAFAGLQNQWGKLTLGRQYTPYYSTLVRVGDPFAVGFAGSSKNLFPTGGNNIRTSNTIMVTTNNYSGFSGDLSYTFGEQAGSNKSGRQVGAALTYAGGPLNARLAYLNRNNDVSAAAATTAAPAVSTDLATKIILAANYNFGVAKAYFAYSMDEGPTSASLRNVSNPFGGVAPTASLDSTALLVGFTAPFGATTLIGSYIRKDDKTSFNQDADQWALGAIYAVSKRTNFYTAYGRINNKNGAGYTVGNNEEFGTGDSAFNAGVRHTF